MEKLTIFTPTYNRKKKLLLGYEALCRQTNKDFIWLIIDDGSTDDTEALVHAWKKKDNGFKIEYVYKENGGLHTGYNKAIELMETELCICIDSDDYMPDDGVEFIIKTWTAYGREQKGVAGIVGLDFKLDGTPLGGEFPKTGNAHLYEIRKMHKGDIKIVCKTALLKALPMMPTFGNEKNFNPFYYYMQVDINNKFLVVNKNLFFVEYQEDGMSNLLFYQFRNSPYSFAQYRRLSLSLPYYDTKTHFKNAIHYVSSCLFSSQWDMLQTSPKPFLTFWAFIPGCLLNLYIRYKTSKK